MQSNCNGACSSAPPLISGPPGPIGRYAAEGYARAKGLAALVTTFSVGGLSVSGWLQMRGLSLRYQARLGSLHGHLPAAVVKRGRCSVLLGHPGNQSGAPSFALQALNAVAGAYAGAVGGGRWLRGRCRRPPAAPAGLGVRASLERAVLCHVHIHVLQRTSQWSA